MSGTAVLAGVLAYDIYLIRSRQDSLTTRYQDSRSTHPVVTTAVTMYVLAHLWGALPRWVDAFSGASHLVAKPATVG